MKSLRSAAFIAACYSIPLTSAQYDLGANLYGNSIDDTVTVRPLTYYFHVS